MLVVVIQHKKSDDHQSRRTLKGRRISHGRSRHRRIRSPPSNATVDHKFHQLRHRCSQANGRTASTNCCEFNDPVSIASSGRGTIAGVSKTAVGETVIRFFGGSLHGC